MIYVSGFFSLFFFGCGEFYMQISVGRIRMEVEGGAKAESGRRTSERTRGKRVCYNEMVLAKKEQPSPKKKPKLQRKPKAKADEKSKDSKEMDIVRDLLGSDEGTGLLGLGLKLEEVHSSLPESGGNGVEKSYHLKVKEALRTFNSYYLHFIQVSILHFKMHF